MGWDTIETSGLLDDCNIVITGAEFNYDAGYASGEQLLMIFTGTSDNPEHPEFTQFYSIGKGWETNDHGKSVVGAKAGFEGKSQYGLFINRAVQFAGAALTDRGMPDNSEVWLGLSFHVKREPIDYGDIGIKEVLLPTAFNGVTGKAEASAPSAPAQVPEAAAAAAPVAASNGSNVVLRAKLLALGKATGTHDTFIEEVLEKFPEVQQDGDLFSSVVDPTGIYAEANA